MSNLQTFRFADFELDVAAYRLRRNGRPLRIERQPMDVLILLVERQGQLVPRSDIADRLWGKDVFVDVDTGVHTAIRKIRQALGDSAERPTFVETVAGRGYRFVAPVQASDQSSASAPSVSRLAVLPLKNLSGDHDREYLVDGLTEGISTMIGRIDQERLMVIGHTSAMTYKETTKSLADIGRELGVDYLVEGSLQTEGRTWHVTAKLIRVKDQVQIWSDAYTRELARMLDVQRELSEDIAEQIHLRLSDSFMQAAERRHSRNHEAYVEYQKGRSFEQLRNPASNPRAIEHYLRAVKNDSGYALAWSRLALTYGGGALNSDLDPREVGDAMREAAQRAVREDSKLSEAQFVLGYQKWLFEWDWAGAESAFREAAKLDSGNADAYRMLGHALSQSGRHDEADAWMRRARELDRLDPINHALSAQVAFQKRAFKAAIAHAQKARDLRPGFWIAYMQLGQAYEQDGETALALEALQEAARLSDGNSKPTSLRGYIIAKSGSIAEAREVLRLLDERSRSRYVPPYAYALVHAGLEERDAALTWLEQAERTRDVHLIFLPVDPKWDPYRAEPRCKKILARCGFESRP